MYACMFLVFFVSMQLSISLDINYRRVSKEMLKDHKKYEENRLSTSIDIFF